MNTPSPLAALLDEAADELDGRDGASNTALAIRLLNEAREMPNLSEYEDGGANLRYWLRSAAAALKAAPTPAPDVTGGGSDATTVRAALNLVLTSNRSQPLWEYSRLALAALVRMEEREARLVAENAELKARLEGLGRDGLGAVPGSAEGAAVEVATKRLERAVVGTGWCGPTYRLVSATEGGAQEGTDDERFFINRGGFGFAALKITPGSSRTGAEIRAMPTPPIPDNYDLFLEADGGDIRIEDTQAVSLLPGQKFFTAPQFITAGSDSATEDGPQAARPTEPAVGVLGEAGGDRQEQAEGCVCAETSSRNCGVHQNA